MLLFSCFTVCWPRKRDSCRSTIKTCKQEPSSYYQHSICYLHMAFGGVEPTIIFCHWARPFVYRHNPWQHKGCNVQVHICSLVDIFFIRFMFFILIICNIYMQAVSYAVWFVVYSEWPWFALIAGVLLYQWEYCLPAGRRTLLPYTVH